MTNHGEPYTNKHSNSNALLSKERQFATQLCNWWAKYTMGKGAEGIGKDVFLWLTRFELSLQARYLWMINEVVAGEDIERRKKKEGKGKCSPFSDHKKQKQCPLPRTMLFKNFLAFKTQGPILIYSQYFSIYLSHFFFSFDSEKWLSD